MITKKAYNERKKHIGIQVAWMYARTLQEYELVTESNYIFQGRCQQTYKLSFDEIDNNHVRESRD